MATTITKRVGLESFGAVYNAWAESWGDVWSQSWRVHLPLSAIGHSARVSGDINETTTIRVVTTGAAAGTPATLGTDTWEQTWGGVGTLDRTWGKTWFFGATATAGSGESPSVNITKRVTGV